MEANRNGGIKTMTARHLQRLVDGTDLPNTFCAETDRNGEPLAERKTWRIASEADARMFVNYANRHLEWFACNDHGDNQRS